MPDSPKTVFATRAIGRDKHLPPSSPMANFGCGTTLHASWDNYDHRPSSPGVRPLELRQPLPLADGVYEVVYSSHTLEHLPRNKVPRILSEFRRVLKPGGILRIVVPDLELMARTYLRELERAAAGDPEGLVNHEWMSIEMIDQMTRSFSGGFMGRFWRVRPLPARTFIEKRLGGEAASFLAAVDAGNSKFGPPIPAAEVFRRESPSAEEEMEFRRKGENHCWMYDRISLRSLLEEAGFTDVTKCTADESRIPDFSGYHLDTDESGRARKPESLFMEAANLA